MDRTPDVEAVFEFNGTRMHPAADGYRPAHLITNNYLTTGVTVISVVRSPGYRTKIEVSQHGFTVIAPKCPEPMFIPWSEKIHMCVCMDGEVCSNQWIHEKILCFSNQDMNGQWIEMAKTVNHRQTFETDAGQPWVVALTYGSKAKCKKDAARIQQYMQGYSQQSESK